MKTHILSLKSTEEKHCIIAIYTDQPDYRLAFLLNQKLNIGLYRSSSIKQKNRTNYTVFEYKEQNHPRQWYLINNHCFVEEELVGDHDLFGEVSHLFQKKHYYVKKYKKVHYFLKIQGDDIYEIIDFIIKEIEQISLIYAMDKLSHDNYLTKKLQVF
jgi:hypothetical protein